MTYDKKPLIKYLFTRASKFKRITSKLPHSVKTIKESALSSLAARLARCLDVDIR